jgi:hypothetical protein
MMCAALVGCGDDEADTETAETAPGAQTTPAETDGEVAPSSGIPLETFTHELGFTASVPAGWTHEAREDLDLHTWTTPGDKDGKVHGSVSMSVFNTADTAAEWFTAMYSDNEEWMAALQSKKKVRLPEIGDGLRVSLEDPDWTRELVIAAALDGALVTLTVTDAGAELEPVVDDILGSLGRTI